MRKPRQRLTPLEWIRKNRGRIVIAARCMRERKTYAEIATELGLHSRSTVYTLLQAIKENLGPEILEPEEDLYTMREVANLKGIHYTFLTDLCRRNLIPTIRRGENRRLLNTRGLEILEKHRENWKKRIVCCEICGKEITAFTEEVKVCSQKCRYRRIKKGGAQEKYRRKWNRKVKAALRMHPISECEEWIRNREAEERSGVTTGALVWLRRSRLIVTKRSKWGRRTIWLYAASQMDIVREVLTRKEDNAATHSPSSNTDSRMP